MKKIAYTLLIVPFIAGGWLVRDRAAFDRTAWIADYEQLRTATEQSYANLRWSRSAKHVDLVAVNAQTVAALHEATSNSAARRALTNFIAAFNDGHFHVESGPPKPVQTILALFERDAAASVDLSMSGATACRALGYKNARHALTVEGARPLTGSTFAAGTLRATDGRVFGIIRIPLFREVEYASVCESVWETFRAGKTAACEESCQAEFRSFAQHAIAQALADDARALQRAGAQAVIVDLTGNGGGTEWAEYAAAALTPKSLRAPDVAFIRGAHWIKAFNDQIADLETRWQTVTDTRVRALLQMERANLVAMRDSASVTCELGELWRDRSFTPLCWNVVKGAASVLPPDRYDFARPYAGPLYIMTDAGTASASEQFAALLQDNGVAHTIGQKTMGVGCGFTNGGNPTTLEHSGLVIWMPDCARLRPDGSNEFEGVTPDHIVDWGEDEVSKTRALLAALENLPRR